MDSWIDAAEGLPEDREYVRFVVVGHRRSLAGIYENRLFCSRWGSYEAVKVEQWRKLENAARAPRRRLRTAGMPRRDPKPPPRGTTPSLAATDSTFA